MAKNKPYDGHILILGAGLMQKPAIDSAHDLNFHVSVVDGNPAAPYASHADRFETIDLKDRDAIRDFAVSLKNESGLDAVFTAGTDFSASAAYAAEACALPCHTYDACLNASDKTRMRKRFRECTVPSPSFFEMDSAVPGAIEDALAKIDSSSLPLVVKPVDNMGGRGCRLVRTKAEALPALKAAAASSRTGRAIIESYMDGAEFSVDAIVHNGTLTITGFADRHIFFPPYFIEMGHTMPSAHSREDFLRLISVFAQGVAALGLSCGAAKGDLKLTRNGAMIGEIAARLSGGYMSGWTYPYASDCNLTREAILIAAGRKPAYLEAHRTPIAETSNIPFAAYEIPSKRVCAERAWISIPGTVQSVSGINEGESGAESGTVRNVFSRAKAGDEVRFPQNNVEKCGNIISVAPNREDAIRSALDAIRGITVRLQANNPATEEFLFGTPDGNFPPDAFPLSDETRRAFDAFLDAVDIIPASLAVSAIVPACLSPILDSSASWNALSLRETLKKYDELCPNHPVLNAKRFWRACIRGGLQGILYVDEK